MLTARRSAFGFARSASTMVVALSTVTAALLGGCASGAQRSGSTAGVTAEGPATGGIAAPPPPAPPPASTGAPEQPPTAGGACASDNDCVPAGCCHARACVPRAQAPSCQAVMCTQDCRGGTLDCGGHCLCQQGRCVANLR